MMKNSLSVFLVLISLILVAQPQDSLRPRRGSYLYHGHLNIEDNSMLIEEAFNQEAGIIQHITNFFFDRDIFTCFYNQEIPLHDYWHQLSYTIKYSIGKTSGFGDIFIHYRPTLWHKKNWALVAPRISIIAPSGDAEKGLSNGAWGGQFNLAITKRISRRTITHWNAGYTFYANADRYDIDPSGKPVLTHEKDIAATNIGASGIWFLLPSLNLMVEYQSVFRKDIAADGSLVSTHILTLNPGFRFAFQVGKAQIVPGIGLPVEYVAGRFGHSWVFGYLSIEPDYNK